MQRRSRGQASAETMLVVSVVCLTVIAAASTMIPLFRSGVENLGEDVKTILSDGSVGSGSGSGSGSGESGSAAPEDYGDALNDMENAAGTQANDPDIGSIVS